MMSTSKATKYLDLLHASLHAGRYNEIPELSRKLRKHDANRVCLARSAEVQALLSDRLAHAQEDIDEANFNNQTRQFQWLELSVGDLLSEKELLDQAYASIHLASSEDKEYFEVANLFYGTAIRRLNASMALSAELNVLPTSSNYQQFMTLSGIISELKDDPTSALSHYQMACSKPGSVNSSDGSEWRNYALYRTVVLSPSAANYDTYMQHYTNTRAAPSARHLHVLELFPNSDDYRKQLLESSRFPNAKSTNIKLLDYVSSVVEPWIAAGSDPVSAESILKLLHEAALKTFHSPRILRYDFRALSVLQRYDEAALALDAYLQIAYHASKTQPGGDVDSVLQIIETIHYAVCHTFRNAPVSWQGHLRATGLVSRLDKILLSIQAQDQNIVDLTTECHGVQQLLIYEATGQSQSLKAAVTNLSSVSKQNSSSQALLEVTAAHIFNNDITASMSSIYAALRSEPQNPTSLLVFANLLCCEELYDRALAVLSSIYTNSDNLVSTKHKISLWKAKFMEIKVREITDGASVALDHTTEAFDLYTTIFGAIMSEEQSSIMSQTNRTSNGPEAHVTNGIHHNIPVLQTNGNTIDPISSSLDHRQNPQSVTVDQTDISTIHRRPPGEPLAIRSASVKLSHPRLHVPHMHFRRTASLKSRSRSRSSLRTPQEGSSRSSSPMNHPPQSLNTVLGQPIVIHHDVESNVVLDEQKTAADLQNMKARELLVNMWLYVARLSELSGSSTAYLEAQQAINEAQTVAGQTPRVLVAQLELRSRQLESYGGLDASELMAIEEAYEAALTLDVDNQDIILALANHLLRDTNSTQERVRGSRFRDSAPQKDADRTSRAYSLIESIKSSPAALQPEFWRISADIAALRGELERAEEEYWRAVELSDMQGVMPWKELF